MNSTRHLKGSQKGLEPLNRLKFNGTMVHMYSNIINHWTMVIFENEIKGRNKPCCNNRTVLFQSLEKINIHKER